MTAWLENLLSQTTVARLGWMLVHFLWQGTVAALLLAVCLRRLRNHSANVRYITACAALAAMVLLPIATIQLLDGVGPAAESGPLPAPSWGDAAPEPARAAGPGLPLSQIPDSLRDTNPSAMARWEARIASILESAMPYLVAGWLVGVFGLSTWHLGGWVQLQRLKRCMVRRAGAALRQQLAQIADTLGVHRAVTLLESTFVEVPTVVGWLRPVILLPASALTGLSAEQLAAILAHELAHIRRCDYLVNVLQTVVEILGFYHPAVWWVSHQIRVERENCCDDVAVLLCGDGVRYARALTCLEESRRSHGELALTAGGGSLLDRVARLLGRSGPDDRRVSWLPGTIALLVAGIVIPMALALAASASDRPEPPSADVVALLSEARDTAPTEEPDAAKVSLAMEAAGEQEKAEVDIQVMILAVGEGRRLDTKTVRQIEQILGEQVRAQDRTGGFWRRQSTTVGEVFRKHILWRHLSPQSVQALTDLLSSKKNVTPLAKPRVLVPDGEEARVWIGSIEPVRVESSDGERAGRTEVKMVDVGVKICVTPHVGDQNNVTVSLTAEVTDLLPRPGHPDLPLVRCRTADQTFTISSGRYFVSTMPTTTGTVGKEDSLYILVMPSIVKAQPSPSSADTPITPQTMETRRVRLNYTDPERALRLLASAFQPYVRPEPGDSTDPNNRDLIITAPAAIAERIVAEIRSIDVHPRNILIDALVAVMDSRDLQDLGIDWGTPSMPAGSTGDPAGRWPRGITVGISFDKTFRQSLDTILNPLKENNKAHVISAPRVVACEGRRARIRVNQEDHVTTPAGVQGGFFFTQAQSEMIVSGTTVEVTPLVGDNNIITLETAVEVSDTVPRGRDSDLSAVTRRTAWNSITIRDGGTIAIAGLAEGRERAGLTAELRDSSPAGQGREDESSRELVLFLTATIVPQTADTQAAHP